MKILLTGSSGRVGRAIHFLLSQHHCVVSLDRSPSSATQLIGDICDQALIQTLLKKHQFDAIVHTAALHAPHVGLVNDNDFHRINVQATKSLADVAIDAGVRKLILTSTTALYGYASTKANQAAWISEDTTPRPRTVYHTSKLTAEEYLESKASKDFQVVSLRMSRCFPEPAPIMASYRLHRGVDARDVAVAHAKALQFDSDRFEKFIISGTTPFLPEDCEQLKHDAAAVLKMRSPALVEEFANRGWPLPKSIDRVYDSSRAAKQLGWQTQRSFESVLHYWEQESSEVLPPNCAESTVSE